MTDFTQLKQMQSAVWSSGAFEEVAPSIHDMHEALVAALAPEPGEPWLDIGCGAGHLAEIAAGAGARVTGIDLSPRLIEVAKARAAAGGYEIEYRVGDAEQLDIEDAGFGKVVSSVGMIFAPDHDAVAREVARVTRPAGRLAFSAWTPEGTVGSVFKTMGPFMPPPPEGAGMPLQWGSEDYVHAKLDGAFEIAIERRISRHDQGQSVEEFWEAFSTNFGPIRTLRDNLEPERREELEQTMLEHFRAQVQPDGRYVDEREYLLVTGRRR
jgi:SAM-dependent methyltransferase